MRPPSAIADAKPPRLSRGTFSRSARHNLNRAVFAHQNALPAMIERGGSIINVTSDAGQVATRAGARMAFPNLD